MVIFVTEILNGETKHQAGPNRGEFSIDGQNLDA